MPHSIWIFFVFFLVVTLLAFAQQRCLVGLQAGLLITIVKAQRPWD